MKWRGITVANRPVTAIGAGEEGRLLGVDTCSLLNSQMLMLKYFFYDSDSLN